MGLGYYKSIRKVFVPNSVIKIILSELTIMVLSTSPTLASQTFAILKVSKILN